jgi:hypothetical protein
MHGLLITEWASPILQRTVSLFIEYYRMHNIDKEIESGVHNNTGFVQWLQLKQPLRTTLYNENYSL